MAQLPPKVPNMTHNWPSFPHQKIPSMSNFVPNNSSHHHSSAMPSTTTNIVNNHHQLQPSWVDEFLDFSSSRRGAHRRSVSADSIAFLDSPPSLDECRNSSSNNGGAINMAEANCFDRLDDEQLMSMFSDDVSITLPPTTASSSNPSTPSDQNSNNDDKTTPLDPPQHRHQNQQHHHQQPKNEPGEAESSCQFEAQPTQTPPSSNADQIIDPKRVKRILANRQSAQRSRVRKLQYISELERSVTTLQTEVSALSPRVAFLDHQRLILNVDNSALKQRIAALAQDKIFKDAHQEALRKEIERLRQVYHQQNIKKINTNTNANNNAPPPPATSAAPPQPTSTDTMVCTDKDQQLLNLTERKSINWSP